MAKVSIIVPVYGVEDYLEKCVYSLTNQTFKEIEIILVDDGSKDRCPQICDELSTIDERIKVVHKPNGGLSDARNCGLQYATSDYIIFIDSDDYASEDMCEVLYSAIMNTNADVCTALVHEVIDGKLKENELSFPPYVCSGQEALGNLLKGQDITMYAYGKIYKKTLFDGCLYPKGKIYEDAFTTPYLLEKASKVCVLSDKVIYYVRRNDSITLAKFSNRDFDCIEAHKENLDFISRHYPFLMEAAEFRYFWSLLYIYDKMLVNGQGFNDDGNKLWGEIKKYRIKMMENHYLSKQRKIAVALMSINKKFYEFILKNK